MRVSLSPLSAQLKRPVREENAKHLIEELSGVSGIAFSLQGVALLGDLNGAAYVSWPDGREGVVVPVTESGDHLRLISAVLAKARKRGVPVPRYDVIVELDEFTVVVQERLPGGPPPGRIDAQMMQQIVAVTEMFEGLLAGDDGVPTINLGLRAQVNEAGRPKRESLEAYSSRTRSLWQQMSRLDGESATMMAGSDLVHQDLEMSNVLFDDDLRLTGVIDWHDSRTLRKGDFRYSLVPLSFGIGWGVVRKWTTIEPEARAVLEDSLDQIDPDLLARYWAYTALHILDLFIRRGWHGDVETNADIAASRLF